MARRIVAHGRVQGVFFRAATRDLAARHGLVGWVRNEPDGTLTAHLEGEEADVAVVVDWIRAGGPPDAVVRRVDEDVVADQGHERFVVRR